MKSNVTQHGSPSPEARRRVVFTISAGLLAVWFVIGIAAQQTSSDMEILREKIKADRKLLISENMELSEAEAQAFWPIYDSYQQELQPLNERVSKMINDYAASYETMTDQKAQALLNEAVAIEQDRAKLMQSYLPKFSSVLPARKVARYYQIENKIRSALNYELASFIPLVE
jgi:hypothetical protein